MKRLVIDIGNTACKLGIAENTNISHVRRISHQEIQDVEVLRNVLREFTEGRQIERAVIASVVPLLYAYIEEGCRSAGLEVTQVRVKPLPQMRIRYKSPETLGIDRYCAALGAVALYGAPCIAIDLGTATTVNVVNASGEYMGGAIGVGIRSGYRALHAFTAQLPALEPAWKSSPIGQTTEECIHSGVTSMHIFGLRGMVEAIKMEIGGEVSVIFTGGNAEIMPREGVNLAHFESDLVLIGANAYENAEKTKIF